MEREIIKHEFEPVYDKNSKVLILGTMPSPKSREYGFYYSHPQNRFWRLMADIFDRSRPEFVEEKRQFLYENRIALWDVLKSCSISGADDASIREPIPNDIGSVLRNTNINTIFTTGKKAYSLYMRYCFTKTGIEAECLPSTSPANCRYYTYEQLLQIYRHALSSVLDLNKEDL